MKTYLFIFFTLLYLAPLHAQTNGTQNTQSIYFGGGSYYIDGQQIQELQDFLNSIEGLEQYSIIVHSHTDNIGSLEYNQWLSQMRSSMTLRVLQKMGIPPEIISVDDFGEQNPVYENTTREGKLKNRRVDVILIPPSS